MSETTKTDTVTLMVDGLALEAKAGQTVLEACRNADIHIPTLCADPRLEPYGACRMCIVEIEGVRGYPTSCTTTVVEGMTVTTQSEALFDLRKTVVELLLSDHKHRVPHVRERRRVRPAGRRLRARHLDDLASSARSTRSTSSTTTRSSSATGEVHHVRALRAHLRAGRGSDGLRLHRPRIRLAARHPIRRVDARERLRELRPVRLDMPDRRADRAQEQGQAAARGRSTVHRHDVQLLRGRLHDHARGQGRRARRRVGTSRQGRQQRQPVREGPLRLRLREPPRPAHHPTHPPRRQTRAGDVGRGARPDHRAPDRDPRRVRPGRDRRSRRLLARPTRTTTSSRSS